ncbi:YhgE/Pip domain-containing protein [Paenibacillus turpanensis]|uniref:YhgE/Pip domain-containing protein n=1 Tax=Paenibacillus turpanensis TaxID=2689078 RepID=UPI00140DFAE0|nr:DUF3533 domain-containing protein [Paenibacillus turpanensis]
MGVVRALLSKQTTKAGIITAIMFQLIFSVIWMTGYQGINDNMKNLTIAVVNEDQGIGKQIVEQVKAVPFQVIEENSLESAQALLENRSIQMVMHIPANFSQQLQTNGSQAALGYYINESNPQLIKSVMSSASATITGAVGKQVTIAGTQSVLTQAAGMPAEQAGAAAQQLSNKLTSELTSIHPVQNFASQMVPMMTVLASYVGSMLLAMNMEISSGMTGGAFSKWQRFAGRNLINVAAALIVSLAGSGMVLALGGQSEQGFFTMWMFQALFVLVFMLTAQVFILLLGVPGMLFNIILLSAQLVSSGAMVPRELLSGFYHGLSVIMPATYAVQGNMNILFGGSGTAGDVSALLIIGGCALVLGAAAVAVRKEKQPKGAPGAAQAPAQA